MLDKINIVNILLTRKCNYKCSYCRISGDIDYILKPPEYPGSSYYFNNEKPAEYWIEFINNIRLQNPNVFFLIYGGEPFLYKDIYKIVIHLNQIGAYYSIISNCSSYDSVTLLCELLKETTGKLIHGFTASVDPGFWHDDIKYDEVKKSVKGFELLRIMARNKLAVDLVAEVTAEKSNMCDLIETVKRLDDNGITSDITTLDLSRSQYYDFSSITNPESLVPKNEETQKIFEELINSNYKIHMKNTLLPKLYDIVSADYKCDMPNNFDNITIEPTGELRLCLRIRGRVVPKYYAHDLFYKEKQEDIMSSYGLDYSTLCQGCNWTCKLQSSLNLNDVINH